MYKLICALWDIAAVNIVDKWQKKIVRYIVVPFLATAIDKFVILYF